MLEKGKEGKAARGFLRTACGFAALFLAGFQRVGELCQRLANSVVRYWSANLFGELGYLYCGSPSFGIDSRVVAKRRDDGEQGVALGRSQWLFHASLRWGFLSRQVLAASVLSSSGGGMERGQAGLSGGAGLLGWGLRWQALDSGQAQDLGAGLEFAFGPLALRGGWDQALEARAFDRSGATAGLGLAFHGWGLDYAWNAPGGFSQHRLSLSFQPVAEPEKEAEAPAIDPALLKDADKPLPKPDVEEGAAAE